MKAGVAGQGRAGGSHVNGSQAASFFLCDALDSSREHSRPGGLAPCNFAVALTTFWPDQQRQAGIVLTLCIPTLRALQASQVVGFQLVFIV